VIALAVWPRHAPSPVPAQPVASAQSAPLPLPDKPSVAVLPFTNIGGDAKQERLADGITEDVITDLSRYRALFVIARDSVFAYKGRAVSVQQVGRDLGVRYMLEGSIQTSGERVRVTAQLIEAATGGHLWSEQYNRALDDIFDVQNEVTQKDCRSSGRSRRRLARVRRSERQAQAAPGSLQAYDYSVLGVELLARQTREDNSKAEELFKRAIELDPQFARGYSGLSTVYENRANMGWWQDDASALFEKAKVALLQAIALDSTDGKVYALLGNIYFELSDFDHGLAALERAFFLNPNDPQILIRYGRWLSVDGRAREGVEMVNRAFRLNPHYPDWYNNFVDPFYVAAQCRWRIPSLGGIAQAPLLPGNQPLAQSLRRCVGRWGIIDEPGVVMHAWAGTVALQDGLGLAVEVARDALNCCVHGYSRFRTAPQ
jgi:adenylate cyclase